MKQYTVYKHPKKNRYEAIKIGFAWTPFLCSFLVFPVGVFWLMERRLVFITILYGIPYIFLGALSSELRDIANELSPRAYVIFLCIYFLPWLLVGFKGNQWSHNNFKKKGYHIIKTVKARTRKSAVILAKNLKEEDEEVISGNKECPMCAETIKARAKICRFCSFEFE